MAAIRRRPRPLLAALAGAVALGGLAARPAAAQDVDSFATSQAALSDPPGGASSVATAGTDILGQHRGLTVARFSGAGPVTAEVSAGALAVSVASTTPASRGEAVVSWDGDMDARVLSATGLGGVNLAAGGDAFRLTVPSATAGVELTFTVYTDALNASVQGLILPSIATPTDVYFPFASFVTRSGAGADFTSVGAITLSVRGTGATFALDHVQVVATAPAVTATKTDGVTAAAPGDTLNYTVTLGNAGPGTAGGVTLTDTIDANTTLVAGSVEVSPLARDDQYAGATVGTVFSVGAPGVLANDVDGDGDPLAVSPAGPRPTAQGGSATVNGDGSFSYTPPAAFQGLDTFGYQADDGNGIPGPGTVTVHVACGTITVSPTTLAPAMLGSPYGPVTFTATGATGAVTWSLIGTLPTGMNFSAAGVLDGTPTQDGPFPLTFVATDTAGCTGSQAITLEVHSAPTITSAGATTFTVGMSGSFTVTTSGFPRPSIARGGVALPPSVGFVDNGDGTATLSGTPDPGTGGTYALTFTATNTVGSSPVQSFTLTVNEAPTITSANNTTFTVGQMGTFTVTTTGFPAPSIAPGGVPLPPSVGFVDNGDGTGTLSGTPDPGTGGTYALTFTATNAAGSSPMQSFTLTVNESPEITSAATATFAPGLAGQTFTVTTTGFPRNPGMVITRTGPLPTGVTFTDNTDGTATVSGTPAAGTQAGSPYLWTITASNGVPPDAVQNPFTFNVVCPVITVSGTIPPLTFNTPMSPVTFTQTGGNGTINWSATGLPPGLAIGMLSGQVSGTPTETGTFDAVITATDAGGCPGTSNVTVTVAPVAVADTYNGGVDNTQYVVVGGATATPATPSVKVMNRLVANDLPSGAVTATAGMFATSQGGSVVIQTDGTFLYTPPPRSGLPPIVSDTFTYTVQSNTGGGAPVTSAAATVTINLSGRVWYVLNNGPGGNGQSQSPFLTLAQAQGASTANDHVFVYRGDGTTNNLSTGILLKAGQALVGQGVDLMVNGNLLVPATSNPVITNSGVNGDAITLASGTTVAGLNVSNPSRHAFTGTSITSATVTGVAVNGAGGAGLLLSGNGSGTVSFGATVSNVTGRAVDIRNRTGGTVAVTGAIGGTGTGVFLDSNTGAVITFSGGLSLSTGASAAFTATGGGTVEVCDEQPCNPAATGTVLNDLTTTTGTALTVANTDIGANNLEFRSVSANGGANGIFLQNTGASGGLKVKGDNANTARGGNASGGTIQNMTGADGATAGNGIYLENTRRVALQRMQLNGFQNSAIRGLNVTDFTLQYSTINGTSGSASGPTEGAVTFGTVSGPNGLSGGTNLIDNCLISGAVEHNLEFYNYQAAADYSLTVSNSDVKSNSVAAGSDGIQIETGGAYANKATIVVNTVAFDDNKSQAVQASALGSSTIDITISNSTVQRTTQGNEGFVLSNGANGTLIAHVTGNTITGLGGATVFVGQVAGNANASASPRLTAVVQNNTITHPTTATNHAIIAFLTSTVGQVSRANILIDANNVTENSTGGTSRAIIVDTPDAGTTPTFTATVTNNTVAVGDNVGGVTPIAVQARQASAGCFDIRGNDPNFPNGIPAGQFGIRARQANTATASLEQGTSGSSTAATVLSDNNPLATPPGVEVLGTVTVVPNTGCLDPPS